MPVTSAWGAGSMRNRAEDASTKEHPMKEAPSSPMAENDFTIKAFGADSTEHKASNISSTLQRKESLPKASPSPSPRGERKSEVHSSGVPVHQRLYEAGLATRQKKEEAAAKQAAELTFKPEISPRSRNMSASGRISCSGKPAPVYERLSSVGTESQKRLEKLRQERLEAERKSCTFSPRVNSYSEKLLTQRTSNYGGSTQARQQAFMKKMNQTFGGSMMRTSGYGNPTGVNHPGSASIGGSIRSRQLAERKSLVGCDGTPPPVPAANQGISDKMKKQLQAAYGIKPREETPLEEVERWFKASLKEQDEIEQAIEQAHLAALAESLTEVEGWWTAACREADDIAAAAAKAAKAEFKRPAAESPIDTSSTESADQIKITSEANPDQILDQITSDVEITPEVQPEIKSQVPDLISLEDEITFDVTEAESKVVCDQETTAAAAPITPEAAAELEEEKLDQVKDIIECKEKQLLAEITQLDSALVEVRAASPLASRPTVITEELTTEQDATVSDDQQVEEIVFTESPPDEEVEAVEQIAEEPAEKKLSVRTKAAIKYHTACTNAVIILQGSKTRSAIRSHTAKIGKALKSSSSSSGGKIKRHTAAMAAAIQKRAAKMAAVMTQHSVRIAALKKDAAAAAAIEQQAAEFSSKVDQISSALESEVQQSNTAPGSVGSSQKTAVGAAIKAAAARLAAAINEYAALTAATLGKHGSSIVTALQQLAARIAAALRLTAARITKAIKQYRSSITNAGMRLHRSRAVRVIA